MSHQYQWVQDQYLPSFSQRIATYRQTKLFSHPSKHTLPLLHWIFHQYDGFHLVFTFMENNEEFSTDISDSRCGNKRYITYNNLH